MNFSGTSGAEDFWWMKNYTSQTFTIDMHHGSGDDVEMGSQRDPECLESTEYSIQKWKAGQNTMVSKGH